MMGNPRCCVFHLDIGYSNNGFICSVPMKLVTSRDQDNGLKSVAAIPGASAELAENLFS